MKIRSGEPYTSAPIDIERTIFHLLKPGVIEQEGVYKPYNPQDMEMRRRIAETRQTILHGVAFVEDENAHYAYWFLVGTFGNLEESYFSEDAARAILTYTGKKFNVFQPLLELNHLYSLGADGELSRKWWRKTLRYFRPVVLCNKKNHWGRKSRKSSWSVHTWFHQQLMVRIIAKMVSTETNWIALRWQKMPY